MHPLANGVHALALFPAADRLPAPGVFIGSAVAEFIADQSQ